MEKRLAARLLRVAVLHEYLGSRVYEIAPSTSVEDIKELIYVETDFPVSEQRLLYNGKELYDSAQIGSLLRSGTHEINLTLQGRGLKGGGRFGQTTPPLVDFLKDILRRYPEGGQILKELIQNAEDAGATEVKFLYDETEYGTDSLWSELLMEYQGPALYSYNNAVFTPEDWHGIQEIARSRKRDDPLKVGRFGIGFNSVYHVTDVPCIFSGTQIGILDPHQSLFGSHESGQSWNLTNDREEISEHPDQFAPYVGIFDSTKETFKDGFFPGTIFRFPLRKKPSYVSNNVYNKDKVLELFESFKADASSLLLFLKNVQSVTLYSRESNGTERMLFRVIASEGKELKQERPNSLKILRTAADRYCNNIPSNNVTCVTYHVNIVTEDVTSKEIEEMSWLVCNSVGGRGMCNELDCLAEDLKYIPNIGIAMPLLGSEEVKGAVSEFIGRAFCFLPLPPGEESKTGLPVHISGFFGLTDNRRSIKWREVDQWRDPAALWNELLVNNVVPKTYATLILEAVKRTQAEKDQDSLLTPEAIHKVWPDVSKIRVHWKPILEPLFKELIQHPVIYSMSNHWVKVDLVYFCEMDYSKDFTENVLNFLNKAGVQIARVPANVSNALKAYISDEKNLKKVSPSLVRQMIRKFRHRGSAEEKLHLLEYVLTDHNFGELIGVELLPLQNGNFISFDSSTADKDAIYIATDDHPRSLFPGLEGRFLAENLKPTVLSALREAAESRGRLCTQLQLMTTDRSARLIKELANTCWPGREMMVHWSPKNLERKHPPMSWLTTVWRYLYHNFPEDLTLFEELPLIPKMPLDETQTTVKLLRLRAISPIIMESENESQLPAFLPDTIEKLGGVVIKELDPCLQHPLMKKYIHSPLPSTVLQILDKTIPQKISSQVMLLPPTHKVALRCFLASLPEVNERDKKVLQELMIFNKVEPSSEKSSRSFIALRGSKVLHHTAKLPPDIRMSIPVINCSDEASIRLVTLLKIEQLKSTDCLKIIIQDIEKGFYSNKDVTDIVSWILINLAFLKDENALFVEWLKSLKFISTSQGRLMSANELFDPEIETLQHLFYADEKALFPPDSFTSTPDVLHALRQIGLKNEDQLTEKEVIQVAKRIEVLQSSSKVKQDLVIRKAKTLLAILHRQNSLLLSTEAKTTMQKLKWVPVCKKRPLNYPQSLVWKGDVLNFHKACEMRDLSDAVLVGSAVPLVENISSEVRKLFGFSSEPDLNRVLGHLKNVVDWHTSKDFNNDEWYQFQHFLLDIYDYMQGHLEKDKEGFKSLTFPWVWTGKVFSVPRHVAIKPIQDLDLEPYLHILPKTMAKYHTLFTFFGALEEVNTEHSFSIIKSIKQKSDDEISEQESKQNLLLVLNILRWLYSNQIPVNLDTPIPIHNSKDPNRLAMEPIQNCSYCDIKVDDLNDLLDDSLEPVYLVHEDIPMKMAQALQVPCLSTRLINPENLGFEQSGQREPLTVRIRNILDEYPSVADIFKELLQNADDAEGTECSFLIDMRRNADIRENLLDPGMAVCHGPALWSFNNSDFTDADFVNITRLGGSLKRSEVDKVGKFGLGFNSVYHITDIPIILSREFMIMFDPNINHLGKHIRDKTNPGIKINWNKHQKRLRKFSNQFRPFVNVFGCDLPLVTEKPFCYLGTLFRLPFRMEEEASVSEISSVFYNTADIYSLVDEFSLCGHRLILFSQNVNTMFLKYLKSDEPDPSLAQTIIAIKKVVCSSKAVTTPMNILKEAAKLMKTLASTRQLPSEAPRCACIVQIVVDEFLQVFRRIVDLQSPLFRGPEDETTPFFEVSAKLAQSRKVNEEGPQKVTESTTWLICSCMDTGEALIFSLQESGRRLGLVPCGAVSVLLSETEGNKWSIKTNGSAYGEVFCYLPLIIKTGLPVHINGCFAVSSNRKEIWKTDTKGKWNNVFMRHVIVQAYLEALAVLRDMAVNAELVDYNYYTLWPDITLVHDDFAVVWQGLYEDIAKGRGNKLTEVFSDGTSWVSIKSIRFLDDALLHRPVVGPLAFKILLQFLKKAEPQPLCAVELPSWVRAGFEEAGCKNILLENTFSERKFFTEAFFPYIEEIEAELRDPLMLYVLDEKIVELSGLLRVTHCVPSSGEYQQLSVPSRLIHPEGRVAKLYEISDGRFPYGTTQDYLNPVRLVKLVQLGMIKDDISWEDLLERAESVAVLNQSDHAAACLRSSNILSLIDEKLKFRDHRAKDFAEKFQSIPFLPFLKKPPGFSLHWKGNDFQPETMFPAKEVYALEYQDVVCLLHPILNENPPSKGCGALSSAVKDMFGLLKKPPILVVLDQLKKVATSFDGITLCQESITNACYKYLHEAMLKNESAKLQINEELQNFNFVLVENTYVEAAKVAFHLNFDATPYLYQLPNKYRNNFREFFEKLGVQSSFTVEDFASVLQILKTECDRDPLTESNFQLCRRITSEGVWGLIREKNRDYCKRKYGTLLLPDGERFLVAAKSLCYNDCPWIRVSDKTVKYCHPDIPREVAVKLGALPKRHKALERYASNICFTTLGSEFGQKEKLTSRIKSILNAYPSEKEMLKELLQNADDAKATEIYFIFDPRDHPGDRIFDEKWAPLQGPAICVYNNQPFTEDDIRGIQNLGRGTKEGNPGKTGQYGIGFNSVYHITDCPAFISDNDVLCIFDPHARYAPGSTNVSPGRMFRDLDSDFRTQFTDVLNPFLGNLFKLENATMFRFPVRNAEMCKISEICQVPVSDQMVQNLLDKLRSDGAELLMFLNHMEKISICDIEKTTGNLNVLYSVKAKITDGDRLKRKQFHASVLDSVNKRKQLSQIPVQQITYTMDIEDSEGNLTTWLVCNRSGFSNIEKVSKTVISAHKNEDITLFPRGGVAACISHNYKKPHRAFCFLPLSLETGLPVHVNGHFALDSARRNLWRDDNGVGVRSDWNNNLMTTLIAPAYVELLVQIRKRYFLGSDPTITVLQNTPNHVLKDSMKKFMTFFAANKLDIQPDWYCLVRSVYCCLHDDLKRLLPVVRIPNADSGELQPAIFISWVNTSTTNRNRSFFDNLLQDELQHMKSTEYNIAVRKTIAENVYRLKNLLLDIGFNLVYSSDETSNIYHSFQESGIPVHYVTPADVREFLHSFASPDSSCHLGKLPCRLHQTILKLFHNLKLLVDYCFKDSEENEIRVEGLPLLITLDNVLQVFDAKRPKFLTTYHELIPTRKELFMNTLYMKYNNILLNCGVAKVFDISSFAELLSFVLPRDYRTRSVVKWKDNFGSESWLKNCWHFISDAISVKEGEAEMTPTFETTTEVLKDWALLPGTKFTISTNRMLVPEYDVLVPLSLMHVSIYPNGQNDKVFSTLMKAGCIQLAFSKICAKENILVAQLALHLANIERPGSILKALDYMIRTATLRTNYLSDNDFEALLIYFNSNLNQLTAQDDSKILKSLPCYRAINGNYISILKYESCFVLTKSIPLAEVDRWALSTSFAFLADNSHLKDLYAFLDCIPVDDLEVYLKHLLPKFDNLSSAAKIEHLVHLKKKLSNLDEGTAIRQQLFEKLEDLAIIPDSFNRLKSAKNFYDRTENVFEVMLPENAFIPQEFFRKLEHVEKPKNRAAFLTSWITFFRNIGLKYTISQQQLLQFAKEAGTRAQAENWSKETIQSKVDVLLNHIFHERTDLFSGNFLKDLSLIPFIYPERAPAELLKLHPQFQELNGILPLIRFSGAQVNPKFKQADVVQLLWTSCPILPEKATPSSIKEQEDSKLSNQEQVEDVLTMLNVSLDPSPDKVISNCKNICNIASLEDDMIKTRVKVLRSTYEFLNAERIDFRFQLRGVAFVMVEDGWKLLKPEEVVINLENESDFKPYLYKLPLELGTFHQLFKLLGTEDIVSTKQYVEVLGRIFKISEGKQLEPNEMRTVKRAVSGLFKSLQNEPLKIRIDLDNVRELGLYLPSHDGRLTKSNILVFDDAPHYKSRMQGNVGVLMLVDLSQCYLGKDHSFHTKLIMLLPSKLRPRLLSGILEEILDEETPKMCQFGALCSLQGRLQLLLSSEQFIAGLIRIMKHENDNAYLANEEKANRLCRALREGLKVSCFEKLQTSLRVKGFSPIPHSKSETLAFLKRYGNAVIHLYIQHAESKDINFLLALAMTLKTATDNLILDTSYLIAMLGCNDIYRINEKLDNLGVKYDSSTERSKLELPLPGTPIPAEIHYLLLMDPMNVFYPGEYVGYLVDAEGGDIYGSYQPTYTYAIIVQEVEREGDEHASFLGKYFQIDIGYSEYKIVSSLDLYKFSRPDESSQGRDSTPTTPTSPTECLSPGPRTFPPHFPGRESHRASASKHQSPKKIKLHCLPEILREVTVVLEQAWRLPEPERKKIIRRLYLKWHPDKNAENLEIATEVFKHLQNEINRLEKQGIGGSDFSTDRASRRTYSSSSARFQSEKFSFQRFYTSWNQEATSHKSDRQHFKGRFASASGSSHSSRFFVPPTFKTVGNPIEARRWLRQARANFSAARNDLHKNANEWVCFKCYLAAKLALIAAEYAVKGKSDKDIKPTALAQKVEEYSQSLVGLATDVNTLEAYGVDGLRTRYPDLLPFPLIPNDKFTTEVAMRVMECTARIIIKLENFIQQKLQDRT
uniref:sacsin isoform X2 n=1 Tax=Pristiophorus japonicus TaxID=55135 RepID=UPI00398E5476